MNEIGDCETKHARSNKALSAKAAHVLTRIAADRDRFFDLPDDPGARIHALFAGLYWCTTDRWLKFLGNQPNPEFGHMVILQFYNIYHAVFDASPKDEPNAYKAYWQNYGRRARRLTFRDTILSHLILISLGARAHTRHDLENAIYLAALNYRKYHGSDPDFERYKPTIVSRATSRVFCAAALDYIATHHQGQTGWRRAVLRLHHHALRFLQPIWLPVFQGWRQQAWDGAIARFKQSSGIANERGPGTQPVFTSTALSNVSTGAPS